MKNNNLVLFTHNFPDCQEFLNVIDSILVAAAFFDQELIVDESFVHVSFLININQFMTKMLIFEVNGLKDKRITKVYLKEWDFGHLSKVIRSSKSLIYKNGRMSKPITEFISFFKEGEKSAN